MADILLVEDDYTLRDAYAILLQAHDFALDVAANGQQALDLCKKNTYRVILLDLMMPVLDGAGFLEQALLHKTAPQTRVVLLSNLSSGENLGRALKLGAHRHVVKSDLAPDEVIALIREELQR